MGVQNNSNLLSFHGSSIELHWMAVREQKQNVLTQLFLCVVYVGAWQPLPLDNADPGCTPQPSCVSVSHRPIILAPCHLSRPQPLTVFMTGQSSGATCH